MRLLYITNGFPFPLTSGYLRHYHLLRWLAQHHSITLASIVDGRHERSHRDAIAGWVQSIHTAAPESGRWGRRLGRLVELAGIRPARSVRQLRHEIARLVQRDPPDAVVFSGKRTVPILDVLDGLPIVADLTDATSERLSGMRESRRGLRRLQLSAELRQARDAERRLIERATRLVFASERDRDALLRDQPQRRAASLVIPNGVDTDYWHRQRPELGQDCVVFSGVMSYEPNADAALVLIREVMPSVWTEIPSATCAIVGRDPGPELYAAAAGHRCTITGSVDDMRPHLEEAAVFAAPLRFGAGIQNKVLEALAMEIPAVVSPLAAAGLAKDDRQPPLHVADGPAATAHQIVTLLHAGRADASPLAEGRAFVEREFSWARSGQALESALRELAEG